MIQSKRPSFFLSSWRRISKYWPSRDWVFIVYTL